MFRFTRRDGRAHRWLRTTRPNNNRGKKQICIAGVPLCVHHHIQYDRTAYAASKPLQAELMLRARARADVEQTTNNTQKKGKRGNKKRGAGGGGVELTLTSLRSRNKSSTSSSFVGRYCRDWFMALPASSLSATPHAKITAKH